MRRTSTLVTIPFSHYCELARWSLDAARMSYVEQRAMPGFHIFSVARASTSLWPRVAQKPSAGSQWAVPMLILPDGCQLQDSHEIAKHAAAGTSLYPDHLHGAIDADLLHCHDRIGPATRRFAYYHLFNALDAAAFADLAAKNGAPAWQATLLSTPSVFARVKTYISKGLGVSKERALRSEGYVAAELDALAERRRASPSAAYLHGAQATIADLSFAALLAPVLGVPCQAAGVWLPPAEALGAEYVEKTAAWREHAAGSYAADLLERRNEILASREP